MDKDKLDKKLRELKAPEPLRKDEAIKSAMNEFSLAQEKNIKGISDEARPMDRKPKGGSIMDVMRIRFGTRFAEFAVVGVIVVALGFLTLPSFYAKRDTPKQYSAEVEQRQELARQQETKAELDESERVTAPSASSESADMAALPALNEQLAGARLNKERDAKTAKSITAPVPVTKAKEELKLMGASGTAGKAGGAPLRKMLVKPSGAPPLSARGMYMSDTIERQRLSQEYIGRDRFEHKDVNPVKLTAEEPVSTFSIDVDTTSYSFVRRALNQGHLPQKDAVRIEEMINYFDYDYEVPRDRSEPFKPTVAVYETPWNNQTKLLHIGIKGYDLTGERRPKANLVFLIDVSGSMESADKLPLLKKSLRMLVDNLAPDDTVAMVVYAGAPGTVLEPTPAKEKSKIFEALDRLSAGGSTAGGEGIRLAYSLAESNFQKDAVNRVILATDGDFNVGIRNPEELKGYIERKRETGVYLSVLGFGQGNYNDELMQKLAQNGNGNAAYIDTLSEARKVLVEEAGSTLFTIANDVKIQVEFNPEMVAEYRLIGYETRMLKREDFNNDKVDAGDIGAGHSVTAIYEITPIGSKARLIEPLRYYKAKTSRKSKDGEYAFLKIRYKLPDENKSRLITKAIGVEQEFDSINDAPQDMRFAASVGAFGQILRGAPYIREFSFDDVLELARSSRGDDPFGYRNEFVRLIGLAKSARTIGDR
jgi:Ca-activated chloride channel family protein